VSHVLYLNPEQEIKTVSDFPAQSVAVITALSVDGEPLEFLDPTVFRGYDLTRA